MEPKLKTLYYQDNEDGTFDAYSELSHCDETRPVHIFKHSFSRHLSVRRTLSVNKPEPTTGNA